MTNNPMPHGTPDDPWWLTTAPGSSTYPMHRDVTAHLP